MATRSSVKEDRILIKGCYECPMRKKRLAIIIDKSVLVRLKKIAAERDESCSSIVRRLLNNFLNNVP